MARAKTPWEKAGISKSTWYRNKKKRKRTRAAIERAITAPRGRPGYGGLVGSRFGDATGAEGRDRIAEVEKAVDAALVSNAVAQLEHILGQNHGVGAIISMSGTGESWTACTRALRKAGY